MATYTQENDIVGGGYGFGGGGIGAIILLIVAVAVLWFLGGGNRRDGHYDGYAPYANYGGCAPCVQPTFKDESNFEEERNINSKLCKIDEDVWKNGCKDREATHCEGEKTRALIEQNYIQDLRDKLAEKNAQVLTLKQEMFTEKKFDQVLAAIGMTNGRIEKLECEVPKRPPVFAECVTPNTHDIDCDDRRFRFPRRGRCDDDCCFG